ncbi:MAG: hypothetical protein VW258_06245 [Thalassolituus sp.]
MRTKIGNYKLNYIDRKRKDWRRAALTQLGLLVNAWVSTFFVPVYWLRDSEYGICVAVGSALALSLMFCIGLHRIRNSPVRESFWVSKIPSIAIEFSIPFVGFFFLINFLVTGSHPIFLFVLAILYALPFVYESVLPRPATTAETLYMPDLSYSWKRCWKGIGATSDGEMLKQALVTAWNEAQRKYHTEQHLRECLVLFEEFQYLAEHPHEVELAIWFHDAVYDVKAKDNELKSAEWARTELLSAGVSKEQSQRVYDLIMATEHSAMDTLDTLDKQLLVDIDLAILGSSPTRFAEYEQQVRAEYSYVPSLIFRWKRKQVLGGFLKRDPIYQTPDLKLRFELQARLNLS